MSVVDESDDLMRSVTSALNYCLDYVTGTRLPVPEWVRLTRDHVAAAIREHEADNALRTSGEYPDEDAERGRGPGGRVAIVRNAQVHQHP